MEEFLNKHKKEIAIVLIVIIAVIANAVFGGTSTGTASGNAKLDQSKKVESTVDQSTMVNSTKLGNIGKVGGDLSIGDK